MGVLIIEPKTPPLVIVNVPPVISSKLNLLSRALLAKRFTSFSISSNDNFSALRITGTTNPLGALTAIDTSQ